MAKKEYNPQSFKMIEEKEVKKFTPKIKAFNSPLSALDVEREKKRRNKKKMDEGKGQQTPDNPSFGY